MIKTQIEAEEAYLVPVRIPAFVPIALLLLFVILAMVITIAVWPHHRTLADTRLNSSSSSSSLPVVAQPNSTNDSQTGSSQLNLAQPAGSTPLTPSQNNSLQ